MLLSINIYSLSMKTQQRLSGGGTLDFVNKEIASINFQTCCHEIYFAAEFRLALWPEDISRWYLFMSLLRPRWLERRRLLLSFLPSTIQFTVFLHFQRLGGSNDSSFLIKMKNLKIIPRWLERRRLLLCFPFFHQQSNFQFFFTSNALEEAMTVAVNYIEKFQNYTEKQ